MKQLFLVVCLCVFTTNAYAQNPQNWTSGQIRYYNVGAPAPVQTETFLLAAVTCNLATRPGIQTDTVNPVRASWNDAANAGRFCAYTLGTNPIGLLPSTPNGVNYEATIVLINAAGPSTESVRSPFSKLDPVNAAGGLLLSK